MKRLGIQWQISELFGWGVFGLNLTFELLRRGEPRPLLLKPPLLEWASPLHQGVLGPLIKEQQALERAVIDGHALALADTVLLHSLGDNLVWSKGSELYTGESEFGFVFSEHTRFETPAVKAAKRFNGVMAGSTWNAEVLAAAGLVNVHAAPQGIDTALFHPAPEARGLLAGRFAVFSGGKMEYRKGQDIALAAFRRFRERRPDAVLMTCWGNPWPETVGDMTRAGHVSVNPAVDANGALDIQGWAAANGVGPDAFVDLGVVPNGLMPQILHQMDAALFPNRCEGGTNLVAMECMACGVPTILSANTGHLDLIAPGACFALRDQAPVPDDGRGNDGWGETSVDEAVEALDAVYQDRAEAARRAVGGAAFMRDWSWKAQTDRILSIIVNCG